MVKITGPLHSDHASKQLGKNIIFKTYGNRHFVTNYNKPASVKPFTPSPNQYNQRMLYNLIIARWQTLTDNQKAVYNDEAREKGLKMSGWNRFYQLAINDLPTYIGLQGYWAFNKIVSGQIRDLSGNKNHGDLKPSYPANAPVLVDSINKKFGKAGSFDGIDDYVDTLFNGTEYNTLTLSFWAKFNVIGLPVKYQYLLDNSPGAKGYMLRNDPNTNSITMFVYHNVVGLHQINITIPSTNWHQYTAIIKPTQLIFYRDGGNKVTTGIWNANTIVHSPNTMAIGSQVSGADPFNGLIDEVHAYNRAPSEAELNKHYQLKFS